jgi:RNA-binding protein
MDFENPPPFSSADVSVIIHATEDDNKIIESLSHTISVHPSVFRLTTSIGHWGNRILLINGKFEGAVAKQLFENIWNSLNSMEKTQVAKSQDSLVDDKGNLYVRLNKQRLCQKRISLSESDSVRFRFRHARRYKMDEKRNLSER